jgi:hypothetical protein
VLPSIDLHYQRSIGAVEVDDVRAAWNLAFPPPAAEAAVA